MEFTNIITKTQNYVSTITINRPNKLNALNKDTLQEIHNAVKALEKDENMKVIILTGRGIDLPDIMDASRVIYLPDMDAIESKDTAKRGGY